MRGSARRPCGGVAGVQQEPAWEGKEPMANSGLGSSSLEPWGSRPCSWIMVSWSYSALGKSLPFAHPGPVLLHR